MTRHILRKSLVISLFLFVFLAIPSTVIHAQAQRSPVECGTILEAELTPDVTSHFYTIESSAGDHLTITAEPIGQFLNLSIRFMDPRDTELKSAGYCCDNNTRQLDVTVSATGRHTINVFSRDGASIGAYTLYIGCVLRNGTVIAPGDAIPIPSASDTEENPSNIPAFSGYGFPGLDPVDFSDITKIPLIEGVPLSGIITPTGNEIIGFTYDSQANTVLDLAFARLTGNLNLGIVVLSPENEVVFQVSLITSNTFSTQVVLPTAGEYVVAVFRIDLRPPQAPEGTAFQLQMQVQ
jgi:hypothetical protein